MMRWLKEAFGVKKRRSKRRKLHGPAHIGRKRIGNKVRILIHEGREPKQAVAIAYAMAREGKLGAGAEAYARRRKRR